ncbi:hypothetical protein [Agrobacterium larrymoorei]|uniref:hypothetical protein n=1 Tax=Agrobacterium larrymoorei TaxID=160699 RepID=UPI001F2DCB2E|nr:hypothetical protein [Agrobacterium larrymoorei]
MRTVHLPSSAQNVVNERRAGLLEEWHHPITLALGPPDKTSPVRQSISWSRMARNSPLRHPWWRAAADAPNANTAFLETMRARSW